MRTLITFCIVSTNKIGMDRISPPPIKDKGKHTPSKVMLISIYLWYSYTYFVIGIDRPGGCQPLRGLRAQGGGAAGTRPGRLQRPCARPVLHYQVQAIFITYAQSQLFP